MPLGFDEHILQPFFLAKTPEKWMGLEDYFIYFPLLFGTRAVNFLGVLTVKLPGFQSVSFQRLAVDDSCWFASYPFGPV